MECWQRRHPRRNKETFHFLWETSQWCLLALWLLHRPGALAVYLGLLDAPQLHLTSSSVKVTTSIITCSFWSLPFYLLLFYTLSSISYVACPSYFFFYVLLFLILIRILFAQGSLTHLPFLTVTVFMASSSFSYSLLTFQLPVQFSSGFSPFCLLYCWQSFQWLWPQCLALSLGTLNMFPRICPPDG